MSSCDKKKSKPSLRGNRQSIPVEIINALNVEAGFRCAIVRCQETSPLDMAHIIPYSEVNQHSFDNMILLCKNHHGNFDKRSMKGDRDSKRARTQMKQVKENLKIINGRYSHYELRLMYYFANNPENKRIQLFGREIDIFFLLNDGVLVKSEKRFANAINYPPEEYLLTEKGIDFINALKKGKKIK